MTAMPRIPKAAFYECSDAADEFEHESPDCAVEEFLSGFPEPRKAIMEIPVEVICYRRVKGPEDRYAVRLAEMMAERLTETWDDDEWANPHRPSAPSRSVKDLLESAAKAFVAEQGVWGCEEFARVKLTPDEVEEMMREHAPEWFEEEL